MPAEHLIPVLFHIDPALLGEENIISIVIRADGGIELLLMKSERLDKEMCQSAGHCTDGDLGSHILLQELLCLRPGCIQQDQAVLAPLSKELIRLDHQPGGLHPGLSCLQLLQIGLRFHQGQGAPIGEIFEVLGENSG